MLQILNELSIDQSIKKGNNLISICNKTKKNTFIHIILVCMRL